jgi:hypothetical protein
LQSLFSYFKLTISEILQITFLLLQVVNMIDVKWGVIFIGTAEQFAALRPLMSAKAARAIVN